MREEEEESNSLSPLNWSPDSSEKLDSDRESRSGSHGSFANVAFHPISHKNSEDSTDTSLVYSDGTQELAFGGLGMSEEHRFASKASGVNEGHDPLQIFDVSETAFQQDFPVDHMDFALEHHLDKRDSAHPANHAIQCNEDHLDPSMPLPVVDIPPPCAPFHAGTNPRVIQTPHGPAFLLNAPVKLSSTGMASTANPMATQRLRKFQRWSDAENEILRFAVESEEEAKPNWKKISRTFFANSRTPLQCKTRWTKSLQPGVLLGNWQEHEDEIVKQMRGEGFKWSQIADQLPGRIGEHVRDRYVNFLDPELKKSPWTKEEDKILYAQQKILGNKWTAIAKFLPGRSENSVKNRWHNAKMTQRRRMRKHAAIKAKQTMIARRPVQEEESDDESYDTDEVESLEI